MADLGDLANSIRQRAYAPYSGYKVGAAIEDERGRVFVGCNVENVSFGATICAERSALARMIAEGGQEIRRIAVATSDGGAPCGICLQTILEFSPDPSQIVAELYADGQPSGRFTLAELFPNAFVSKSVKRNEPSSLSETTEP